MKGATKNQPTNDEGLNSTTNGLIENTESPILHHLPRPNNPNIIYPEGNIETEIDTPAGQLQAEANDSNTINNSDSTESESIIS